MGTFIWNGDEISSNCLTPRKKSVIVFFFFSYCFLVSETKNQWARDDPAFVVICSLLLAIATFAYCAA